MRTSVSGRLSAARTRRAGALLAAGLLVLAGTALPRAAQAASPGEVKLRSDGPASYWAGTVRSDGPGTRQIPECRTVHCEKLRLTVALPPGTWTRPGGVQVAIRWDGATEGGLGLFVYRGQTLVAKSTAGVGTAQSVIIPSARNGSYDVYVSYGVTFGAVDPDRVIAYQGLAEVEYRPTVQPVRDLLPDLRSLPQENVTYDNPGTIFGDTAQPGQSCFDSERSEQGARQCLRFDQVLQNAGTGPVELHYSRQSGVMQDEDVWQRVYRSDSTWQDLSAGQVEFHPIHGHYHFKGFAQSELWLADRAGRVVGSAPAAVADKVSFCIADTDLVGWGTKGDAALSYPAPACLDPKSTSGGRDYFDMGMSPGWADRYNWYLPDQMIDTYGLADGTYVLFTTVDPDSKLSESDETNNCSSVIVALSGLATSQPQAQLRGVGPACP
ncbi:lysyl oxidase family protein [Micromonospora sp. NPDC047738]|uniref:lysyl oxidase family protein n=1 Tax=unclassified Micromonospora TaxID=2617518 RepID=UPI0033CACE73